MTSPHGNPLVYSTHKIKPWMTTHATHMVFEM